MRCQLSLGRAPHSTLTSIQPQSQQLSATITLFQEANGFGSKVKGEMLCRFFIRRKWDLGGAKYWGCGVVQNNLGLSVGMALQLNPVDKGAVSTLGWDTATASAGNSACYVMVRLCGPAEGGLSHLSAGCWSCVACGTGPGRSPSWWRPLRLLRPPGVSPPSPPRRPPSTAARIPPAPRRGVCSAKVQH